MASQALVSGAQAYPLPRGVSFGESREVSFFTEEQRQYIISLYPESVREYVINAMNPLDIGDILIQMATKWKVRMIFKKDITRLGRETRIAYFLAHDIAEAIEYSTSDTYNWKNMLTHITGYMSHDEIDRSSELIYTLNNKRMPRKDQMFLTDKGLRHILALCNKPKAQKYNDLLYDISDHISIIRAEMHMSYMSRIDRLEKSMITLQKENNSMKRRITNGHNTETQPLIESITQSHTQEGSYDPENPNDGIVIRRLILQNGTELVVEQRASDRYVNVTAICDVSGKRVSKWKESEEGKALLEALSKVDPNPVDLLMVVQRRGVPTPSTFAHPDIAIQIAQWCNPYFTIQVSRWVRELMTIGKVELGKEKTEKELMKLELENIRKDMVIMQHSIQEKDKKIQDLNDELYKEGDIYVIKCTECDKLYVGSSLNAEDRFKQHMSDTEGSLYKHFLEHGRNKLILCPPEHHRYHVRDGLKALEQRKYEELIEIHGRDKLININNPVARSRSRSTSRPRV